MLHLQLVPIPSGMGTELHWQLSSVCIVPCLACVSAGSTFPFLLVVAWLTSSFLFFYSQLLLPQTFADPVLVDFCFLSCDFPLVLQWFPPCIANVCFSNSAVPWIERLYFHLSALVPPTGSMEPMNQSSEGLIE